MLLHPSRAGKGEGGEEAEEAGEPGGVHCYVE